MNPKNRFLVPFLMCLGLWLIAMPAQGQGFGVGNYQVLSSTRVGRTEFEYVIGVTISNQVASALGVTVQVYSVSTNTVIIQGNVNFGDVALGASAVSTNTITIRQNRLAPFNPADLAWFVTVNSMPLSLTVISPVSGFLTNGSNVLVTGTIGPAVEGVTIGRSTAALNGTNFSGTFPLEEGRNTISVLASNVYGGSGLINVFVTRDTTPPVLNIETPTNGTVLSKRQVTVSGLVNDAVPGTINPEQASVMVNGLSAMILNRSFSISDVLLVPGTNTITAIARDRAGNESQKQIQLVFIDPASQKHLVPLAGDSQTAIVGTMLPQPLLVELVNGDGVVQTNQPVTFAVTRNDGILFASPDSGRTLTMLTDEKGQAKVLFQLGTRTGVGNNQVVATSPGVNGQLQFEANAVGAPPAKISPLIPETQVGEVNKPLPQPWTAYATDSGGNPVAGAPIIFTISQGGGNLGGATTISTNTDSDGRAFVTLTLGPDEGINNNVVLAGSPGVTNSSAVFTASGQTPGAVNATRVVGLVLDNANRPMSNILCVIANTTRAAVTDQQGQFAISRAPVGAIRLVVDAQNRGYPGEWHALTFNMVTVAGRDTSLDRPIYMVQVDSDSAAMAGGDQDVTLYLKDFPGAYLTVYAHSVRNDQGQPVTNRVTWTQVNAERIPMAPPQGSQPILTTAILPAGLRFNPPAKMCIPNSGLPPGQILELYGFDHDIGSFVSVGTATVSSDGSLICSHPGFGVVKSGWHPYVPPPPPCTAACTPVPAPTDCERYVITGVNACKCPVFHAEPKVQLQSITVVSGASQNNVTGTDNWAAVKGVDDVVVEATISPNTPQAAMCITWSGGSPVSGHPLQRKLSKTTSAKTTITASSGSTSRSINVWIVWANVTVAHSGNKTSYDVSTDTGDQANFPTYTGGTELGAKNLLGNSTPYLGWKVEIKGQITPAGVHQIISTGWALYQTVTYTDFINNTTAPTTTATDAPDTVFNAYGPDLADNTPDVNERIFALDGPGLTGNFTTYKSTDNFKVWVRWNGVIASDPAQWWIRQKAERQGAGYNVIENDGGNGTTTIDSVY
jgi:hypothetical protein